MSKILITGAAGNIGSELTKGLLTHDEFEVCGIDNLLTGKKENLPIDERLRFALCDVNDYQSLAEVMHTERFDYVFHFAAVVGVSRTLANPIMVLNDIEGIKNILNLCRKIRVKRFFFSSSSEVYGEPVEIPQNEETTPLNSRLPYAVVKNIAEAFIRTYHAAYNLNYTIFRFFNTYGPSQTTDFVIPRFIDAAINNQDLTLFGNGLQTRTFCYISDNIDTIINTLKTNQLLNETLNVGSDIEWSIKEVAEKVLSVLPSSQSKIIYKPSLKEGDMTRRKPDIRKMRSILGRDLLSLEEGIKRVISINYPDYDNL